jgi:hypothetical protein
MKLVYKILFAIVIPIAIISVVFIFFIQNMLYNEVESRFLQSIENTTDDYATLLNLKLQSLSELANYSAKKLEDYPNPTKNQIQVMIRETVSFDSIIFGAAIFFDTAYTGKFSRSFYYAFRDSNEIIKDLYYNKDSSIIRIISNKT